MSEQNALSLGGSQPDRPVVDVYGKSYTLRGITRSVQNHLQRVDIEMQQFLKDEQNKEDAADKLVEIMAAGLDALLAPDGGHRTSAKKLVVEKWNADALTLDDLRRFFDSLQEQASGERPT